MYDRITDSVYLTDTVRLIDTSCPHLIFKSVDEAILFVRYVKTQSSRFDTDNELVMQALINRCRKANVSWYQYYLNPRINHSRSIQLMKQGRLRPIFDWANESDVRLLERAIRVQYGEVEVKAPDNLLYFHSFKDNRFKNHKGIWNPNNLWGRYRHKFYIDPTYKPE